MKLPSRFVSFVAELRRRRVLQATAVYATAAFVAVQVAAVAFPALRFPDWAQTLVVVLAVVGFPVVVAVSWAFELTSEGLRRTVEEGGKAEVVHARGTPWVSLSLVVVVTAMSAGIGWVAWDVWLKPLPGSDGGRESGRPTASLSPTRVAVLPFRYRDGGPSGEERSSHIAEGLTTDLIHELKQVAALDVVSERGVLPYQGRDVPPDSAARALGAGSVVQGAVESLGDSVRVTVQLVDGETAEYLMSRQLVRSRDSVLALRNDVIQRAARDLRRELGEEVQPEIHRAGTRKDRAWEAFHQAEQLTRKADEFRLSGQRELAGRFYARADSLYRLAREHDGKWAAPVVARGWLAYKRSRLPGPVISDTDPERLREGIERAESVLKRNPGHAGALELRGVLRSWLSELVGPDSAAVLRQSAEEDLEAAVTRETERARAWMELSWVLRRQGRLSEARTAWREARQADAFLSNDAGVLAVGTALLLDLGEVESALRWARKAQELYPEDPKHLQYELMALATTGAPRVGADSLWRVLHTFEDVMPGSGEEPQARMWVAAALARLGLEDSARAVLGRARDGLPPERPRLAPYYEANVWLHLGRRARTLQLLAEFLEENPTFRTYVANDVWWRSFHGDSAFEALVAPEDSSPSSP